MIIYSILISHIFENDLNRQKEGVNNIWQQKFCHHPQGNSAVSCPDYSGCLQQRHILPSMFGEIITPEAHSTAKHDSLLKKTYILKES